MFYRVYEDIRAAFFLIAWVWGLVFMLLGMVMTFALIAWPFSSKPIETVFVGMGGVVLSLFGAWVIGRINLAAPQR